KSSRTYRQVVQVLTQQGVEDWGEQSFSYSSSRERLTVNWIRVLKPTGEVISAQPAHEQESLAEVALEAPVYSDEKVRRVTLAGVAPGTLVDWSYTVEKFAPVLAGDFSSAWRVRMGTMARRSRFLVDAPANVTPRIEEENFHYTKRVTDAGGRRVYLWAAAEVPKLEGELFGASPNTLSVHIDVAAPLAWADIARWYAGLSKDRYALSPQLETKLAEVVAGARTLEDSLRAVHRWVAQDFRYVSLSLGIGGYQPRRPADVLETKYGDCKDKATLFIALARRMGLRADPVLLSASGGVDTLLPSLSQFDHMIAAVAKPSGGYTFFDLTSEFTPYGQLPPAEQGEFGLIVHADGRGESVTLPEDSASVNRATVTLVGTLSADGVFAGRYTEVTEGAQQYGLRGAYARKFSR